MYCTNDTLYHTLFVFLHSTKPVGEFSVKLFAFWRCVWIPADHPWISTEKKWILRRRIFELFKSISNLISSDSILCFHFWLLVFHINNIFCLVSSAYLHRCSAFKTVLSNFGIQRNPIKFKAPKSHFWKVIQSASVLLIVFGSIELLIGRFMTTNKYGELQNFFFENS